MGAAAVAAGGALAFAATRRTAPAVPPAAQAPALPARPPAAPIPSSSEQALAPAAGPRPPEPAVAAASPVLPVPAPIPSIPWLGGDSPANREALGYMLASENPRASRLAWFLQCLVINNKARRRRGLGVKSVADALRSGVRDGDPKRRLLLGLDYGPQYDEASGIVRLASTSAARNRTVPSGLASFVASLLAGKLDPRGLVGLAGEACPPQSVWPLLSDWLQFRDFDKTVRAQLGKLSKRPKTAAEVVAQWGSPRLYIELDGLRFYGERPRGEA